LKKGEEGGYREKRLYKVDLKLRFDDLAELSDITERTVRKPQIIICWKLRQRAKGVPNVLAWFSIIESIIKRLPK
jgi:hypothetical protein